jgi:hypothetical protein
MSLPIESAVPLLAVFDVPRSIAFYRNEWDLRWPTPRNRSPMPRMTMAG